MDKGIIESKSIIIDATHTKSRYNRHPIREVLQEHARRLRKEVYSVDEKTKNMMPAKNEEDSIEKEVEYCERLLKTIEGMPVVPNLPRIITAATITSGEKPDGKELPEPVEKSLMARNFQNRWKKAVRQEFQETEEFRQLSKERYKIEAKNSELKNVLGYDVSMGNCLYATKIQGACTIFAANIKRIITILDEK